MKLIPMFAARLTHDAMVRAYRTKSLSKFGKTGETENECKLMGRGTITAHHPYIFTHASEQFTSNCCFSPCMLNLYSMSKNFIRRIDQVQ